MRPSGHQELSSSLSSSQGSLRTVGHARGCLKACIKKSGKVDTVVICYQLQVCAEWWLLDEEDVSRKRSRSHSLSLTLCLSLSVSLSICLSLGLWASWST